MSIEKRLNRIMQHFKTVEGICKNYGVTFEQLETEMDLNNENMAEALAYIREYLSIISTPEATYLKSLLRSSNKLTRTKQANKVNNNDFHIKLIKRAIKKLNRVTGEGWTIDNLSSSARIYSHFKQLVCYYLSAHSNMTYRDIHQLIYKESNKDHSTIIYFKNQWLIQGSKIPMYLKIYKWMEQQVENELKEMRHAA